MHRVHRKLAAGVRGEAEAEVINVEPVSKVAAGGEIANRDSGRDAPAAGKKKALLVGINYIGTDKQLDGCINDVRNQMQVLQDYFGFKAEDMLLLSEDQGGDASRLPTKANIQKGFAWLLEGATAGDELFFQYSGHGSQCSDPTGEEADGKNECICPLDCLHASWPAAVILDDEIHQVFYESLPIGVKCTCIFDSCHSGTIGDLSRDWDPELQAKLRYLPPPAQQVQVQEVALAGAPREPSRRSWSLFSAFEACCHVAGHHGVTKAPTPCDPRKELWILSGCKDNQTSADVYIEGSHQGAFTWAFLKALKGASCRAKYDDLFAATRQALLKKSPFQAPVLSSTSETNLQHWYLEIAA